MNWTTIGESVIAGIVTAIIIAVVVWWLTSVRNFRLERQLRKSFTVMGGAMDLEGCEITLENQTPVPVVVREVTAIPRGKHRTFSLAHGLFSGDDAGGRGFVTLQPYTWDAWILRSEVRFEGDFTWDKIKVVFEYPVLYTVAVKSVSVYPSRESL